MGGRSTKERQAAPATSSIGAPPSPADEEEVTVKNFMKRAWYSPTLLLVLVYVLGAPRKWPGK